MIYSNQVKLWKVHFSQVEQFKKKKERSDPKGLLWPHGPSAVPDRFPGAAVHCCTFEVFTSGSSNPATFLELCTPGH